MAKRFLSNIRINDAYTFPASDGLNNQVIKTDGSGNLTFAQLAADSASVIYKDTFTGNGSTTVFNMANALNDEVQSNIYIDGVYQSKGTYSVVNKAITFSTAPLSGHEIEVISTTGINSGPTAIYTDTFTANGSTTAFTLAQAVHDENQTLVFLNGVYQFKGTYSLSGTTLTLDTAPPNSVAIEVMSIGSAYAGGDILYDHDFTSTGLMTTNGSGVYSITANNSNNWNTAYGWGDHGLSAQDKTDIGNLSGTNTGDQDLSSYATQSYVGTQITNLVDSSPATLNTLNELAAALGDDPNFATTTANSIGLKAPLLSPSFNSGATNVVASFTSTDGTAGIALIDNSGNVELSAAGNTFQVQPAGGAAVLSVSSTNATFTGNVGIGLISPGAKLDVLQEARVSYANSNQYTLRITNTDGNPRILADGSAAHLIFGTTPSGSATATERMRIKNDGKVGIGTTSPATPLEVAGAITMNPQVGGGTSTYFDWRNNNSTFAYSGSHAAIVSGGGANNYVPGWCTGSNSLIFGTGNIERIRIASNGRVGIGTDAPVALLHLKQAAGANIRFENGTTNRFCTVGEGVGTNDVFSFRGNSYRSTDTLSVVFSTDRVGIGTISPGEKLQVQLGNIKIDGGANANERGLIIAHGGLTGNQTRLVQDSSASIGHLYTTERGLRIQAGKDGSATGGNLDFYTNQVARYRITTGGGHQWTTDGSFGTAFTYTFRDAVGINNPNSVSAQAVAGYVMSVGRSSSGGVSGGIRSEGESHFVRGVSFGSSGQGQILNHYEEGTWAVKLTDLGGNQATLSHAMGTYTRIGRQVIANYDVRMSSKASMTGNYVLLTLPFNHASTTNGTGTIDKFNNMTTAFSSMAWDVTSTATVAWLMGIRGTSSTASVYPTVAEISDTTKFKGTIIYFT